MSLLESSVTPNVISSPLNRRIPYGGGINMALYKSKDWLHQKYIIEGLSANDIADGCGIGSQTVLNWLNKFDIPRRSSGSRSKVVYNNTCMNCGTKFEVYKKPQHDPMNKKKFKRCCSDECVNNLRSKNLKSRHNLDTINYRTGIQTKLDREELIRLHCYEYKTHAEICEILKVKYATLTREFKRLQIPQEFFRTCPQCKESYSVPIRSMVDETSNKFKKFCSRKCFLSSRNQTDTWIEREIRSFLQSKNIDFTEQYEIKRMTLDFFIPESSIAIEANGDFWHANPEIYGKTKPLHRIHSRVIEKDKRKARTLAERGITVLVVWENDLANNKETTLQNLYKSITDAI